jgi:nucleoid-associated protein YgaU
MKMNFLRLIAIGLLSLVLAAGCATTGDTDTGSDASAKAEAEQAIADAKAAQKRAAEVGYEWRDMGKLIDEAQAAYDAGDYARAIELARKAQEQGAIAEDQYYLEQAKLKLDKLNAMSGLTAEQRDLLAQANAAYAAQQGREAYDLASRLEAALAASSMSYTVVRGDNLWNIAGKSSVYGNPYQWPLIYKANSDQIKDADLIYPGQTFSIDRNPSAAAVDAAVNHAKTRGAWSLGVVEESDKAYLAR